MLHGHVRGVSFIPRGNPLLAGLIVMTVWIVLLVQPGSLGQVDALFRYQAARSFWTDDPPASKDQIESGYALRGEDGRFYNWFGIGQPALMVPFDMMGAGIGRIGSARLGWNEATTDQVRRAAVGAGVNLTAALLAILGAYSLLRGLDFSREIAVATSLCLLLGTSFLHYAQVAQENNLMLGLTLAAMSLAAWSIKTSSPWLMLLAGLALGAGLTVRLPFGVSVLGVLALIIPWRRELDHGPSPGFLRAIVRDYALLAPGLMAGLLVDRLYHHARFGSWTGTYLSIFAARLAETRPDLPPGFPFHIGFWEGIRWSFASAEKCFLQYDPLLVVAMVGSILVWPRMRVHLRACIVVTWLMFLGQAAFHAKYSYGDTVGSWGPRYLVSSVQAVELVALPHLLLRLARPGRALRWAFGVVLGVALIVQAASVSFSSMLEVYQRQERRTPPVLSLRLRNLASLAHPDGYRQRMIGDADHRYVTPNFAPFVFGAKAGPTPAVSVGGRIWSASLLLFGVALCWLVRAIVRSERSSYPIEPKSGPTPKSP